MAVSVSLEKRLAAIVGLGLLVFSIVAGGLNFRVEYDNELAEARELQARLVNTVRSQAAVAAFAVESAIAKDVVEGLLANEIIAAVRVESVAGFAYEKKRPESDADFANATSYPLLSPVDRESTIGRVLVVQDDKVVTRKAVKGALQQAIVLVLQIASATVLLGFVFRRVVGRPVVKLAHALAAIMPGSGERLPIPQRHQGDEIGLLSRSANTLLESTESAITHERDLRRKVEEMEAHYRRIFETTNVGIMVLKPTGELINCNPVLKERFVAIQLEGRFTPEGENFINAIFVQPEEAWALVKQAQDSGQATAADLQLETPDGDMRWAHCIISVSRDATGNVELIEGVLYDVTARRDQERAALKEAETDALTGLRNRRGCEAFIDRSLRRAVEDDVAVAIMLIDLDGFKSVNDQLGHAAGDEVLVESANRMRHRVKRSTDLVGRLGGDEFVVVAYNCGTDQTVLSHMAGDLVAALREPIVLQGGATTKIGSSIGIARFPADGQSRAKLFETADEAMYAVKRRGKNNFSFAAEEKSAG